ncbi:preprotein translocase subunit SecG [Candidatus Omnitrophota bacterium]
MYLYIGLLIVHVLVSISLVVSVLLQSSKGGGLAGTFGGSGMTGGIFGGRGAAPFLAKATTACAILFMLSSVSLNFVRPGRVSKSVMEDALREGGAGGSSSAVTTEMPMPQSNAEDNVLVPEEDSSAQETPSPESEPKE